MTLFEVAKSVGCSVGLLSQVENDKISPSLATLEAIARALHVPVGSFFETEPSDQPPVLVRSEAAAELREVAPGVTVRVALREPAARGAVEVAYWTLAPGSAAENVAPSRFASTMVYLQSGSLSIATGGATYQLSPGDALKFAGGVPQRWAAAEGVGASAVAVTVLPDMAARD